MCSTRYLADRLLSVEEQSTRAVTAGSRCHPSSFFNHSHCANAFFVRPVDISGHMSRSRRILPPSSTPGSDVASLRRTRQPRRIWKPLSQLSRYVPLLVGVGRQEEILLESVALVVRRESTGACSCRLISTRLDRGVRAPRDTSINVLTEPSRP